ncbi:MAG: ATP-binding protein [Firmicutes bacterium]|nr:ATP-binding protein [Bacillota bacterium]
MQVGVLIVFILSLLICCAIAYMLGMLWFSDIRNRKLRSFFVMGIQVFLWTLLNAIALISDIEYFPIIFTLRMAMVCIVPFGVVWFILEFSKSPLIKNRIVRFLLILLPAIDVLSMVSNPLHQRYFRNYDYPKPGTGVLFDVHLYMNMLFIVIAFAFLILYIIRQVKREKKSSILIFTGVGLLIPYALNMLYTFNMLLYDLTPIGFFATLLLFIIVSHRLQIFNVKTVMFSKTMDSIDDMIILFNDRLMVTDANRRARETFGEFSLSPGQTKASGFFERIRASALDKKPVNLFELLKNGADIEGECTLGFDSRQVWAQKEERTYTVSCYSVYERKKKTGYIFKMADVSSYREMISEIHKQKEKAEAASRSKGEFLSRMSHEMRTPMNAVIGMTQVALKIGDLDKNVENSLLKINDASQHLLGVINDVLDMSKIESGKLVLCEDRFAYTDLLRTVSVLADIHAERKRQKFTVDFDGNLPRVIITDGQRLTQVITNFLSNAFKFTPEGGEICLIVRQEERAGDIVAMYFEVRDSGIGIPEEYQASLFDPFEQGDGSISRKFGGTGLGLAISKKIINLMGGEIRVQSAPGQGSRFMFTLRARVAGSEEGESASEKAGEETNDLSGCRILLAEDIEINREIMLSLFEGSGVVFDEAENGRIALEKYMRNPDWYDIIVMDIQMPEMDGLSAAAAIRNVEKEGKRIPIIAMTANAFKEDVDACLKVGMDDHIAKPIDIDNVKAVLHKHYSRLSQK